MTSAAPWWVLCPQASVFVYRIFNGVALSLKPTYPLALTTNPGFIMGALPAGGLTALDGSNPASLWNWPAQIWTASLMIWQSLIQTSIQIRKPIFFH